MEKPDDIVRDILDRLHCAFNDHLEIDHQFWLTFEDEIRQHWGGARLYIAKTSESQVRYKSMRDSAIIRDFARGEHAHFLARRYGISEKRIKQIVRGNALT